MTEKPVTPPDKPNSAQAPTGTPPAQENTPEPSMSELLRGLGFKEHKQVGMGFIIGCVPPPKPGTL